MDRLLCSSVVTWFCNTRYVTWGCKRTKLQLSAVCTPQSHTGSLKTAHNNLLRALKIQILNEQWFCSSRQEKEESQTHRWVCLPVHGMYSGSAAVLSDALYMEALVSLYWPAAWRLSCEHTDNTELVKWFCFTEWLSVSVSSSLSVDWNDERTLMMLLTVRTTWAHCTESTVFSFRLRSSSSSRQSNTEEIWDTWEHEEQCLIRPPLQVDDQSGRRSDTHLSEEDVSGGEAGRHGGVVPLQRDVDGPVDQLGVFGVVVLQHHGRLKLLGVFAQQEACCHGRRAHRHLAEPIQQTHL